MTLATPLMLLGLLIFLPVLAAFLVRRRRELLTVPSTFLWRAAGIARSRSKRLRSLIRLLSLLACLLGVAALVLAAARPAAPGAERTVAYVVDVSASMGDGSRGTPLGQARADLRRALLGRAPDERVVIIAAGAVPVHLAGPSTTAETLRDALEGIRPTREAADLGAALDLASALVAHEPGGSVVVLHDGGVSAGASPGRMRGVPLYEDIYARDERDNLGITTFATRPSGDASTVDERRVLINVATSSARARRARVEIEALGVTLVSREVEVPAAGSRDLRLEVRSPARELQARVTAMDGAEDVLDSDDVASVTHESTAQRRVVVVSSEGEDGEAREFFLEQALRAAGVREVARAAPAEVAGVLQAEDLVVALDQAPETDLDAPVLYIATRRGHLPVGTPQLLDQESGLTRLRSVDDRHPLLQGVSLDDVTIDSALTGELPRGGQALVELDGGPVVLAGGAGSSGWVYLGVDPMASDLVLRVAFPVIVGNALALLGGSSRVAVADTVPTSEVALREGLDLGAAPAPEPAWTVPTSPVVLLVGLAALLLFAEVFLWRRGRFAA